MTHHPTAVIAPSTVIAADVSIGAFAVVGSDSEAPVVLERECRVGPHSTIVGGVTLGQGCQVRPNSLVETDVPPFAVVGGSPAAIIGYVSPLLRAPTPVIRASDVTNSSQIGIGECALLPIRMASDLRGSLVVSEFDDLPFSPRRLFSVFGVASGNVRGEHAHRRCEQFLIAIMGSVRCIVDDGHDRREVLLDSPGVGLYMPSMIWGTQFGHSADAVLVVLASLSYDDADYIRFYDEFLAECVL